MNNLAESVAERAMIHSDRIAGSILPPGRVYFVFAVDVCSRSIIYPLLPTLIPTSRR
jgi:hypothetical protein